MQNAEKSTKKKSKEKQKSSIRKKISSKLNFSFKENITNTVNSIPYKSFEVSNITFLGKNKYSKTFTFTDINYHTSKQEEQENFFLEYGNILNSFDSTTKIQVTIINEEVDFNEFRNIVITKLKGDNLDIYREEYNQMIDSKLLEGNNNLIQSKYITISFEAHSFDTARNKFNRLQGEMESHFKKLGSVFSEVTNLEKLELLKNIYRDKTVDIYKERLNFKHGREKQSISPTYMEFKPNYVILEDKFCRTVFLRDLPTYLTDKVITEITELAFRTILSINIECVEPDKAQTIVRTQITAMESNQYEKERKAMQNYQPYLTNHKLQESLEEAKELLDDLIKKNQKMFLANIIVTVFGSTLEELDINTESVMTLGRKAVCNFAVLNYQQEVGFNSTLPLGNCSIKVRRTLTTESTSILIPFNVKDVVSEDGNYYGIHSVNSKIISLNRKNLKNANGWILGDSGSGKSFTAKREIANTILNNDDDIIIIDPSREYTYLTKAFGGEVIDISAQSKNYINPMELNSDYADKDDPIILKSEFILSLCEIAIGGNYGLTPRQKTIIDRSLRNVYRNFTIDYEIDKMPTLVDFYNELLKQEEEEAEDIAISLEIYVKGSLDVFAHKTNIDSKNRILCFDTNGLGNSLKTLGLLIVLDAVWNTVLQNFKKGKSTWIYVDEIHLFFKNEYAVNFLQELYKIIRKWGGIPTGITQDIDDLLKNEKAVSMLNNSQFLVMLGQSNMNVQKIKHILDLSDTQANYLSNAEKGSGLISYGGSIIPFKDKFPNNLKLYDIFDTTPESTKKA